MDAGEYQLSSPIDATEWRAYHDLRRRVLFDARGETYDEHHPDEHAAGHYSKILKHCGVTVGVVRIDVDGPDAFFRRVAVAAHCQRRGHGRVLLALAEEFAKEKGCEQVASYVAPDAVSFYRKCGFIEHDSVAGPSGHRAVFMTKKL